MTYSVMLMPSISHALISEKLMKENGIECKLIPTPRKISSNCGVVLRFESAQVVKVLEVVEKHGVNYERIVAI